MSKKINFYFTKRGLCSEIITLIYTIGYTKSNSLELIVNDRNWNANYSNGWLDYFEDSKYFQLDRKMDLVFSEKYPINELFYFKKFLTYLYIIHSLKKKEELSFYNSKLKFVKPFLVYLKEIFEEDPNTIEVFGTYLNSYNLNSSIAWKNILNFSLQNKVVKVKENEILLSHLLSKISKDIWNSKREFQIDFEERDYIAIHVRRGDKLKTEAEKVDVNTFIDIVENNEWHQESIFISSDDYDVIKEFRENRPKWRIFTNTDKRSVGHDQRNFNERSREAIYAETKNFMEEINVHIKAKIFIGSISSNVTKLISLVRNEKQVTFSVDKGNGNLYDNFVTYA